MAGSFPADFSSKVTEETDERDRNSVMDNAMPQFCRRIRDRLKGSVVDCLNVEELNIMLFQEELISSEEATAITKAKELVKKLEEIGLLAYHTLYTCVTKETCHLGHRYVQAVLEGRVYASDVEMRHSTDLKGKLKSNLQHLGDCDIETLLLHMYSKNLITLEEWTQLRNTAKDGINKVVFSIV